MAVFDALLGKPLNIETKLECKNTLARQAIEEVAPKTVRVTSPTAEGVLGGSGFFAGRLATAGKPAAFFGVVHVGQCGVFAVTTVLRQGAVL